MRRIFQDSKGFLWIATWDGISKYDGHKFTNYTTANGLTHNLVNDFYESKDGKIYVAENNGRTDIIQNGQIKEKGLFPGKVINRFYRTKSDRVIALADTNGILELKSGELHKINFQFAKSTFNDVIEFNDSLLACLSPERPVIVLNAYYQFDSEIKTSNAEIIKHSPGR